MYLYFLLYLLTALMDSSHSGGFWEELACSGVSAAL